MFKSIKYAVLAAAASVAVGTQVQAAVVYMDLTDIHPPINGALALSSGQFTTPGAIDDFVVSDGVNAPTTYANSQFVITEGFQVGLTAVADINGNPGVNGGDSISATIVSTSPSGLSKFQIVSPLGVLVYGQFSTATFSSSVGSTSATISSANVNDLDLTPGPVLLAAGITDLAAAESFAINLVNINGGVQLASSTQVFGPFYSAVLADFEAAPGSINLSANAVVPEPASLGLLSAGGLGLLARRRRRA